MNLDNINEAINALMPVALNTEVNEYYGEEDRLLVTQTVKRLEEIRDSVKLKFEYMGELKRAGIVQSIIRDGKEEHYIVQNILVNGTSKTFHIPIN